MKWGKAPVRDPTDAEWYNTTVPMPPLSAHIGTVSAQLSTNGTDTAGGALLWMPSRQRYLWRQSLLMQCQCSRHSRKRFSVQYQIWSASCFDREEKSHYVLRCRLLVHAWARWGAGDFKGREPGARGEVRHPRRLRQSSPVAWLLQADPRHRSWQVLLMMMIWVTEGWRWRWRCCLT